MKIKLYKSVALCSLLALAGCHDFEELNTNPYAPIYDPTVENVSADGIDIDYTLTDNAMASLKGMEGAIGSIFANFTYEGLYNDYQTTTNLTHDIYAGYWGNNVSGFVNQAPTYSYTDGWSASRWKHFYDDRSTSEYSQLVKTFYFCNKDYYHTAFYITRIYYAFLLSMQTDTYGDIPVAYYVKGAMPPEENVTYTPQKEVYNILFQLLDQIQTRHSISAALLYYPEDRYYSQLVKTFYFCNKDYYHTAFYITRIYYAFLLSMQTDTYGDIPVAYYVKGAMPPEENVSYTPQKEVYNILFQLLDQAITELHQENLPAVSQYDLGDNDKCYGGDVDKWRRFANTLRLRLALRVSNVNPELAQTQAKAALTDPAGLMQSQDDNMKQTPKRQYIAGGNENIYALLFSWTGNAVLSKEMERAYKNQALKEGAAADAVTFNENSENCYLDPRCEVLWFRPTPFDSLTTSPLPTENLKRDFNGVMNGETNVGGSYLNRYSANRCILSSDAMNKDYWWNLAREIVWMGYSESLFLKAEAALRWPSLVDETAEALYLKGIKASMDYYEIDADKANEYISHLDGVKAFAGGSKEEQLEQIITQKWIAVFPNGNEGWAEVRRTDYPRYLLAPVNGNNSNGEVASGKLIKRINYPNSESRNPNKPGNVNQGSRVWWDVADTMNDKGQWHTPNNFR